MAGQNIMNFPGLFCSIWSPKGPVIIYVEGEGKKEGGGGGGKAVLDWQEGGGGAYLFKPLIGGSSFFKFCK